MLSGLDINGVLKQKIVTERDVGDGAWWNISLCSGKTIYTVQVYVFL
jgi:hypothetical protein